MGLKIQKDFREKESYFVILYDSEGKGEQRSEGNQYFRSEMHRGTKIKEHPQVREPELNLSSPWNERHPSRQR